ncbi:O-antigen ligase family protein [Synoicihabitans lomoniglobus]|uniref:O-antigen ligase family protein n=1 Tax=Synoicihabitans lomoniglobus TaxID=2909285 RepID=A0AAF0CQW3_9BACT|nr:O-antigen ligase family protein [Opitutaceae bacterium LMO-M01]WED66368.1 O-antigen ligase family protein [Opitutaceae bacterium LMO-M01]
MPDYPPNDAETDLKISKSSRNEQLLRDFKGDLRAPLPLHPLEIALIWVAAINVCSLPWMLGGMRAWAQFISLGLSLTAFGLALLPRQYADNYTRGNAFTLHPWRKLIRWPLFWIGVVFFAYVLIQALNPAWEYIDKGKTWTMRRIDHVDWLPAGMITPFRHMNIWRQMMIWGAPFLLACALWVGFTRRRSVITVLTAIVVNACVLAVVGVLARYTAPAKILWLVDGIRDYCFSSFIYKNHAGSFFALATGLTLSLAVHYHEQATRTRIKSNPAGLCVFFSIILLIAVLLSYSRAAIIILAIFLLLAVIYAALRVIVRGTASHAPLLIAVLLVGLMTTAFIGTKLVDIDRTVDRLSVFTEKEKFDATIKGRQYAWLAGYDMSLEHPIFGWGAGGFRFLFPKFQQSYSEIDGNIVKIGNRYSFWQHVHNDYLQLLIETGRTGLVWMATALVVALVSFLRHGGLRNLAAVSISGACMITLVHATVDFPLQNPAILVTLITSLTLALLLPRLEMRMR